jgi:hypothetical protein
MDHRKPCLWVTPRDSGGVIASEAQTSHPAGFDGRKVALKTGYVCGPCAP